MEYQKIINLLDNTSSQPSKFRTKNWVKINDESRGAYNTNSQKSNLCYYSNAYILVEETINNAVAADADANNTNKKAIVKNCAPFINYISEMNNAQTDNLNDIDIVMPVEHSDNYSNTSGSLR